MNQPPRPKVIINDDVRLITLVVWFTAIFFVALTFLPLKLFIADLFHPRAHHALTLSDRLAPILLIAIDCSLLAAAGYSTALRRKFGSSRLELSLQPAIGGKLAGEIITGKPIQFASNLHITLVCMKIQGYRGTGTETLWQQEMFLTNQIPTDADGTHIPIYFEIPAHCTPTKQKNALIRWHLNVHSPMPGVDYFAKFTIPVSNVHDETEVADLTQSYRTTDHHPDAAPSTIDSAGNEIHFPAARHPLVALENTAFALAFAAAPFALAYYGLAHIALILFSIFFGLIALVIGIDAWGMWFSFARLTLHEKSVDIIRGQFFFSHTIHLEASDINKVRIERTRDSGPSPWYRLEFQTSLPKHHTIVIADGLSRRDADRCATRLRAISKSGRPTTSPAHQKHTDNPSD